MSTPTLITSPGQGHAPAPLSASDKAILDEFYTRYNALNHSAEEKNLALMKVIQARNFFAFGGSETPEMELRANERIYLSQHAKRV